MKFFKPTLVAIALVSVLGCNEATKQEVKPAVVLDTEIQKQAYSLGASIGFYMERNLEQQTKLGMALDKDLIAEGFLNSLAGTSVIEREEIQEILKNFDTTMKAKQAELSAKEAADSIEVGTKFLVENAKKEGVQTTESGLQYEIISATEGDKPLATDTVKVHYVGTLLSGEEFDSSVKRGKPAVFPLNQVIKGWTEGLQLMSVGSKYKFTIPADLAYGAGGNSSIPGNAVIEFEVELLEIQKPKASS
jgi:FKBP-type peptidyl-prolyl cis-trans isomerase FkpA